MRAPEVLKLEGEKGLDRGAIGQDELAIHAGPQGHCRAEVQAELLRVAGLCAGNTAPGPWAPGYTPPLALPSEPPWEGARAPSSNRLYPRTPTPQASPSWQPRRPRGASNFTDSPWPGADWLVSQLLSLMRESPRYPQPCPCHLLTCLQLWGGKTTEGRGWGRGICTHRGG